MKRSIVEATTEKINDNKECSHIIQELINDTVFTTCISYFDFINWHRTSKTRYLPLKDNLYNGYLQIFIHDCLHRLKHKTVIDANIIEEVRVLRAISDVIDAVLNTQEELKNEITCTDIYAYNTIELDKMNNIFPILQNEEDDSWGFLCVIHIYVKYMGTKFGFKVCYCNDEEYDWNNLIVLDHNNIYTIQFEYDHVLSLIVPSLIDNKFTNKIKEQPFLMKQIL